MTLVPAFFQYLHVGTQRRIGSLGPVINILAIFSYANILKKYHIKGIGSPLSILVAFLTKKQKNKKDETMIRPKPRLPDRGSCLQCIDESLDGV